MSDDETDELALIQRQSTLPWIEKYRPKTLDAISSHDEIISTIKTFIKNRCLPHLLFYGPPGTGKCLHPDTRIIKYDGTIVFAKDVKPCDKLLGDDNTERNVINTVTGQSIMYEIVQSNGNNYIVNDKHILVLVLKDTFKLIKVERDMRYDLIWFDKNYKQQIHTIHYGNFKPNMNILPTEEAVMVYIEKYKTYQQKNNICLPGGTIFEITAKELYKKDSNWRNCFAGVKCERITCWNNPSIIEPETFDFVNIRIDPSSKTSLVSDRLKLLGGFIDRHATYNNETKMLEIDVTNIKYYDDFVFIARSLGFIVDAKSNIVKIYGKLSDIVTTKFTMEDTTVDLLCNITIRELPKGDYCGFEIDGNKRFLLEDFTITHNTSTIMACAKELYGEYYPYMVMELNASDDRGIEVVRTKIKQFVMSENAYFGKNIRDRANIFKLVILDETDAMTADAQAILRKIVEVYTYNTRFCLICNYIQNINPALQSRCTRFRFSPIPQEAIKTKIMEISKIENINVTEPGMDSIIKISHGDMRKVLNILQSTSMAYKTINEKNVNSCIGYPRKNQIEEILNSLFCDTFQNTYDILYNKRYKDGLSLSDIIQELHNILINYVITGKFSIKSIDDLKLDQNKIVGILDKMRTIEYNHTVSNIDVIQISGLVGVFKMI